MHCLMSGIENMLGNCKQTHLDLHGATGLKVRATISLIAHEIQPHQYHFSKIYKHIYHRNTTQVKMFIGIDQNRSSFESG